MTTLPASGIEGFTSIASNLSLYRPGTKTSKKGLNPGPKLIVLCSWMGATPKHISKYTAGYKDLYPDSAILLVQSSVADTFAREAKQLPRLKDAVKIIVGYHKDLDSEGIIQLHAMSNGGGIAATRIAEILKDEEHGNKVFGKLILDCVPGRPNVTEGVRALSFALPKNPIIRLTGSLLIRLYMHIGLFIVCTLLRKDDILTKLRKKLNDATLFDKGMDRVYLYSQKDLLVGPGDVYDHAVEAKRLGWQRVEMVPLRQAAHCALVMESAKVYWNAVKESPLQVDEYAGGER